MKSLTFSLRLQSMAALPTLTAHVSRMGAMVTYLFTTNCRVHLRMSVPQGGCHRVLSQLQRIVEVVEVTELTEEVEADVFEPSEVCKYEALALEAQVAS